MGWDYFGIGKKEVVGIRNRRGPSKKGEGLPGTKPILKKPQRKVSTRTLGQVGKRGLRNPNF